MAFSAGAALIGTLVRLLPCFNEFWLDEIWGYFYARELHGPFGVITEIHHSNNHHLMTLFLYLFGDRMQWAVYRIPSLVAGVGTLGLAWTIARRRGRLEALFALVLTSLCFALIQFSSEARGYSMSVFFALAAFWALERFLEAKTAPGFEAAGRGRDGPGARAGSSPNPAALALIFGSAVVLGFLSQLVYLFFYAGAAVWSALRLLRRAADLRAAFRSLVQLHLLPVASFVALYLLDLRKMEVGGGDPETLGQVLAPTLGYTLGLPVIGVLAAPYALLGAAALGWALYLLAMEGDDVWILYLITIVLAPVAVILVTHPVVVAVRYFLIGIALFLLLLSNLLAHLWWSGRAGRRAAGVILAVFLVGNAWHTADFLRHGRGGYLEAVRLMARETSGRSIVVGLDHDFRTGLVLRFYARYLPPGKELEYYKRGNWPPKGPDWIITHSTVRTADPPERVADAFGNPYDLAGAFDYAGLSGFQWVLYRNARVIAPARRGSTELRPPMADPESPDHNLRP